MGPGTTRESSVRLYEELEAVHREALRKFVLSSADCGSAVIESTGGTREQGKAARSSQSILTLDFELSIHPCSYPLGVFVYLSH